MKMRRKTMSPKTLTDKIARHVTMQDGTTMDGGRGLADTRMSPFWILLELRMVMTTSAARRAKLQSNRHQRTNQHPTFYMPAALSVAQTDNVKALGYTNRCTN